MNRCFLRCLLIKGNKNVFHCSRWLEQSSHVSEYICYNPLRQCGLYAGLHNAGNKAGILNKILVKNCSLLFSDLIYNKVNTLDKKCVHLQFHVFHFLFLSPTLLSCWLFCLHHFITKLKLTIICFIIIYHDDVNIAVPSSMQCVCHTWTELMASRAPARCLGGHGFDSRQGLRFFHCPTLVSCWLLHLYHFITELKIHHYLFHHHCFFYLGQSVFTSTLVESWEKTMWKEMKRSFKLCLSTSSGCKQNECPYLTNYCPEKWWIQNNAICYCYRH